MDTPWGKPDHHHAIAPGIDSYGTPSHGGIRLSAERLEEMPADLRVLGTFCKRPQWFEEDCDYALVVLAFPQYWEPAAVRNVLKFIEGNWWHNALACRNFVNLTEAGERVTARAAITEESAA